jgi:non-canonical purine NTP pyrophosphatase (RdgB/HAM1 family)
MPAKAFSVITSNVGKFTEIKTFFENHALQVQRISVDLDEIQELDPLKIIKHKVGEGLSLGYKDFIVEDTSLYIDGMHRLPGPLVKWFLLELGVDGIYKLATSMGNGAAQAETVVAYINSQEETFLFKGVTGGRLVAPRGSLDFGWGASFQPDNCLKTYGEMGYQEKSYWNQRIKALEAFGKFLSQQPHSRLD